MLVLKPPREAAIGGRDDDQMDVVLAGAGEQRRRAGIARHRGAEIDEDASMRSA